jgi:hypothetical protein
MSPYFATLPHRKKKKTSKENRQLKNATTDNNVRLDLLVCLLRDNDFGSVCLVEALQPLRCNRGPIIILEVQTGIKQGIVLFIVSEALLFVVFFLGYFHNSLPPSIELRGV